MIKLGNNNIGRVYLGSSPIGKAYLGGNLVYSAGSSPTPPTPPTGLIPYIRNTDLGAFIDTGITPDNTTKVIVWARNLNPTGGALFGSHIAPNDSEFLIGSYDKAHTGELRIDYGGTITHIENQFDKLSGYHKYELYQGVLKVDDVVAGTNTGVFNGNAFNIHLFGQNRNGNHVVMGAPVDICACKIYKNNVLVRDYEATNSPSVGLYDSVSNTLFTNSGSGSFTYGAFDADAYTPLEYISCNANQYFDTGVKGSYADIALLKFRPEATSAHLYEVICADNVDTSAPSVMRFTIGSGTQLNNRMYLVLGTNNTTTSMYNSTSPALTDLDLVAVKENGTSTGKLYRDNAQIGTAADTSASSSFVTETNIFVGLGAYNNSERRFIGRYYYILLGSNRSLVPAKVNNVAGMYDTYNDVFYQSESGTPFTAGPTL